MTITFHRISKLITVFLFCLGTGTAFSQPLRAVVMERQGDRLVINKGVDDGVKIGQTWDLGDNGKLVVESIREHSASGRLEGGNASVGAVASLGSSPSSRSSTASAAKTRAAKEKLTSPRTPSEPTLTQLRKQYQRALSQSTESRGFATPLGGGQGGVALSTGLEAYNLYSLYNVTNTVGLDPTGSIFSPLLLANMAAGMFQRNSMTSQLKDEYQTRVDVEAIYWSESLTDLQTEVTAAEQGLSVQETLTKKVQAIVEKGVDKYTVFEVRLKNVGKIPAEMEPFKYRIFLMSNEDQPISASRIDEVLDKTLQPGDEVRGMVYFPMIVAAGQKELKVAFEQMFGDRGTLKFSNP